MSESGLAPTNAPASLNLGVMRLSDAEQRLYDADHRPIALERKAFDLLSFLVSERDRVVGKDELLQRVWGRSIASDTVIAQAVSKARKALVLGGGDGEWIDVARGVGYRYVGPAEVGQSTMKSDSSSIAKRLSDSRRGWRFILALLTTLAFGLALGAWWQTRTIQRDPLRVAVLPWRNDSGDPALEWSSLGLQALVVDAMASDSRIAAVSQGDVRSVLAARPDLTDSQSQARYLSKAMGVDHVYTGRLARSGEGLVVELMALGPEAASARVTGNHAATLALAAGSDLTQRLLPGFDPARPPPLSSIAFANEAYARGVDARLRGNAEEATRHLTSALAADPGLLPVRYQLSIAQQMRRDNIAWKHALDELQEKARQRGDRPYQGLALGGQGVLAWREGRLADAERLIAESAQFFDGPTDSLRRAGATANLGSLAAMQGHFDVAERQLHQALQIFEAAGRWIEVARILKNLGVVNVDRGRFEAARPLFERSRDLRQSLGLERDLAETLVSLGATDLSMESPAAAEATLARAIEIFVRFKDPLLESDALARLALAQIAQGKLTAASESSGRSLAAARSADNAAARGLAYLRLALIARLRGDLGGALAELVRAEEQMQLATDGAGLARVALDRHIVERDLAQPTTGNEASLAELDRLLAEMRERGWRVLEAEVLVARARQRIFEDSTAAHADFSAALALADQIANPALMTEVACQFAGAEFEAATLNDDAWRRADVACRDAGPRNAEAANLLATRAAASGDSTEARRWLLQRKQLLGEAWSAREQAALDAMPVALD